MCLRALRLESPQTERKPRLSQAPSPAFPTTLHWVPSLVSNFPDYESEDVMGEKTFPFSTFVPGSGEE